MAGIERKTEWIDIFKIQPTVLYLSKQRYDFCQEGEEGPIMVKRVGEYLFYLEGHEKALYFANQGHDKIKAVISEDDRIDMIAFFTRIYWCRQHHLYTVKDLSVYIVDNKEYDKKWVTQEKKLTKLLFKEPLKGVHFSREIIADLKSEVANKILRTLPSWFAIEKSIVDYCERVKQLEFIKVQLYDMIIGFCAYKINYGINCDLVVLGMYESFHRYGIGSTLIEHLSNELKHHEVKYMSVKTLSERHSDSHYEKTRNFYIKNGFYPFEELTELWGKENPCLMMIKEVR